MIVRFPLAAWAAAGLLAGCSSTNRDARPIPPERYESGIGPLRWSDWSNLSLTAMLEKYGPPTRIESKRVVWENKGPWKQIAVWDRVDHDQARSAAHNIEQTIAYLVPEDRRKAVEAFSGRVLVSADGTELSVLAFNEEYNFLALNLADEIIQGVKTTSEADAFYATTIRLDAAGKSSRYMQGLLFTPPSLPNFP